MYGRPLALVLAVDGALVWGMVDLRLSYFTYDTSILQKSEHRWFDCGPSEVQGAGVRYYEVQKSVASQTFFVKYGLRIQVL